MLAQPAQGLKHSLVDRSQLLAFCGYSLIGPLALCGYSLIGPLAFCVGPFAFLVGPLAFYIGSPFGLLAGFAFFV